MAYDSTIRLRQINQAELSGFVTGLFSSFPQQSISGNIIPSASGVYNVGSSGSPYSKVYTNQLNITSGSGIYFGNTLFNAYTSGGAGVINVGGYTINSSGNFISIQGPQGIQGPSGATGIIGPTGISVTGITYSQGNSTLNFSLSNNTTTGVPIPAVVGPTGVSVTGFYQSGSYIYPQFNQLQGIGAPVLLPIGPAGPPGSISLYMASGDQTPPANLLLNFPSGVIVNNYYDTGYFPSISLMRGMSYTIDVSGLNTHTITAQDYTFLTGIFSGQINNVPNIGTPINYYSDPVNGTGYWRFAFFDQRINGVIPSFPAAVSSGSLGFSYANPSAIETTNSEVYGTSLSYNIYRTNISFNTNFTAKDRYKYGFVVYTLAENSAADVILANTNTSYYYAYICGDVYVSSGVGPPGPTGVGIQGPQGIQGNPGVTGPAGSPGSPGVGVASVTYLNPSTNYYQLQFNLTDGSQSSLIPLPSGGPSGAQGPAGPAGSLTNYFSGTFNPASNYGVNSTISYLGSTYINTGASALGIYPPSSPWQLLAQKGDTGATGATGLAGYADKYYSNFYVISGIPTGVGNFATGITGITVTGGNLSGTNAKFTTGQIVSFQNSGLIGYAYSPYQQILVSTNTYTGSYFYASVNSYNSQSGIISFSVLTGLSNLTGILNTTIDSSNRILWYNYGNATINLGANIMSGAQGPIGSQGPQGPAGTPQALRNSGANFNWNISNQSVILQPSGSDIFNLFITGNNSYVGYSVGINFDFNYFNTGQSVILKIRNSGIPYADPPLFFFSGDSSKIKWPAQAFSLPSNGQAYIYTILRFPDETGSLSCYGTYSNPYY
jgi:hypothetical protein